MSNFRLDEQGRIIPVGNLKGKISTGGLVPGVPIWTGEASGAVATFPDGANNKPMFIQYDENATKIYKRGKNLVLISRDNEARNNGNPHRIYSENNSCKIDINTSASYWIIWPITEITDNLINQYITISANITGGTINLCYADDWQGSIQTIYSNTIQITSSLIGKKIGVRFINNTGAPQEVKDVQVEFNNISSQFENYKGEDVNIPFNNIESYLGYNNIWSDFGNVDIIYQRDWNIALNMLWNAVFP